MTFCIIGGNLGSLGVSGNSLCTSGAMEGFAIDLRASNKFPLGIQADTPDMRKWVRLGAIREIEEGMSSGRLM